MLNVEVDELLNIVPSNGNLGSPLLEVVGSAGAEKFCPNRHRNTQKTQSVTDSQALCALEAARAGRAAEAGGRRPTAEGAWP